MDDGEAGTEGVKSRVLRRRFALSGEAMSDGGMGWNMKSLSCRRPLKLAGGGDTGTASSSMRGPEARDMAAALYFTRIFYSSSRIGQDSEVDFAAYFTNDWEFTVKSWGN